MKATKYFIIAAFLFSIGVIGCGSASGPADVAKDFMTKIEDNDKSAIDHLSPQLIQALGKEKLEKGIEKESENIRKLGGIKSIEIEEETVKEKTARLKLKISYGDGSSKNDNVNLLLEDGKWKIGMSK
ncbi:MAG: DUF4878 domain-containing protein [Ignavibacteriaceae bacterium]